MLKEMGYRDNRDNCLERCSKEEPVNAIVEIGNVIKRIRIPRIAIEAAKKMPYVPIPILYDADENSRREYNIVWEPGMDDKHFLLHIVERRDDGVVIIDD